jgi:hypothetical protein
MVLSIAVRMSIDNGRCQCLFVLSYMFVSVGNYIVCKCYQRNVTITVRIFFFAFSFLFCFFVFSLVLFFFYLSSNCPAKFKVVNKCNRCVYMSMRRNLIKLTLRLIHQGESFVFLSSLLSLTACHICQ